MRLSLDLDETNALFEQFLSLLVDKGAQGVSLRHMC
jgi:hypothetical protein